MKSMDHWWNDADRGNRSVKHETHMNYISRLGFHLVANNNSFNCNDYPGSVDWGKYRYASHNDVSVNDGPHIRRWSSKIIIL